MNLKKEFEEKILAYALDNALSHDGKAVPGAVLSHLFREGLQKEQIKEIMPLIHEAIKKINALDLEQQKKKLASSSIDLKKFEQQERHLYDLPNISKKMVFRLAPFPSGDLHLGNAKTYMLNALYAEKYKGKILLVIDDTIGSEEKAIVEEAYKLIPESFQWLGIKYKKPIIYKSDRLAIYYEYAEKIIELGKAYVCTCQSEILRKNRAEGKGCACRNLPKEEQKKRWKQMFSWPEGKAALRIKTSMQDPNPAFRDRVLFRISEREHPRVGKKYRVWPMLEFSWAIDDHLLGITHIIRGNDLMIETEMERFIWNIFGWPDKTVVHGGFLTLEGIKLSKSKAQHEVKSGEYTGWDDPRTWSMHALRRRGFKPEALRQFIEEIGLNQTDITVPIDNFYAINRKLIDKDAARYSFVVNPVKLDIHIMPNIKEVKVKIHPEKEQLRTVEIGKELYIAKEDHEKNQEQEVRLLHLFNIELGKEDMVTSLENKDIPKINWVSDPVKTKVLMDTGEWVEGYAEKAIEKLKPWAIIQFERNFFARFDRKIKVGKEHVYEFWFSHR